MYFNLAGFTLGSGVLILLSFVVLQWFHVSAGSFLDWVIGAVSFWWLLVITTVPWNLHFQAKAVVAEALMSREKGIPVDQSQLGYGQTLAQRSLLVALILHLLSAVGLYTLAATGISAVGYVSSGAALLLTGLRPVVSAYQYWMARLMLIQQEVKYPREDVIELRQRLFDLEFRVRQLDDQFDSNNPQSFVVSYQRQNEAMQQELVGLSTRLTSLQATNQADHDRLSHESQNAISQLSEDSEFLNHAREIIRFFKTA
ncbi:hypothetical protein BST81_14100 [Leptolyngbya sp. 'hensonii']|nr:hypothetical protein BST81_14100 [Leptolyngbya sp. 'hensonii']